MLVKSKLARQIYICITEHQISQTEVTKIFGIDRAKISNPIDGKLAAFSIERLFQFLNALDRDV